MKKLLTLLLTLGLILGISLPAGAEDFFLETVTPGAVLLLDGDTGEVFYSKNADNLVYPASTTKILTALLTIERVADLDATVTVTEEELDGIVENDDSTMTPMLKAGEEISYRDLLYGMMLNSGNDAAAVLAVNVGGSIGDFVDLMNEKAQSLGMENTHFTNPHGRHDDDHYTTVSDMSRLAMTALNTPEFMAIVGCGEWTVEATNLCEARTLVNTNLLIRENTEKATDTLYPYATGMKTGSTPESHGCLVASAEKNGHRLLCLIYDDETEKEDARWPLAQALFDFGFAKWHTYGEDLLSGVPVTVPEEYQEGFELTTVLSGFTLETRETLSASDITAEADIVRESKKEYTGTVTYRLSDGTVLTTVPMEVTALKTGTGTTVLLVLLSVLLGLIVLMLGLLIFLYWRKQKKKKERAARRQAAMQATGASDRRFRPAVPSGGAAMAPAPAAPRTMTSDTSALRAATPTVTAPQAKAPAATASRADSVKTPAKSGRMELFLAAMKQYWYFLVPAAAIFVLALVLIFTGGNEETKAERKRNKEAEVSSETEESVSQTARAAIQPYAVESTTPEAHGVTWTVLQSSGETIEISPEESYDALDGIATFRGDNLRQDATFGQAGSLVASFTQPKWEVTTDTLLTSDGNSAWTGSGWTGQPLVACWDAETMQSMNLYEDKKAKEGLTEIIYATLDGHIYFIDMEDGEFTRPAVNVGLCFKGSGALDPRGWPLLYVGAGDTNADGERPRMYVISLIDGSILYEYGDNDSDAIRTDNDNWTAFDSSPLVDGDTDTLIWPGENGILYEICLNTDYDREAGTLSVNPTVVGKARYETTRSGEESFWYGIEDSAVIIDGYLFASENGGMMFCVDLKTMELIWVQDTGDDSNSTPVAEYDPDTGEYYLYTAPSLHWTAEDGYGSISVYKLKATTGEIVWQRSFDCYTVDGVSGGVQATPLLGREGSRIEDLIIYPVARTPSMDTGLLVAFDRNTGETVWEWEMENYTWSSPVAVYSETGRGYIVIFDSEGTGYLLNGTDGRLEDTVETGSLVEASPIVWVDRVIIGTRGQKIYAFDVE